MKKIILMLAGIVGMTTVSAQLSYDPGKSVVVTGTTTDASNPHGIITFTNQGNDSVHLGWNVIENTLNLGWGAIFCTDVCYTQVKNTGTYAPIAPGQGAYVSLEIQTNGLPDTGRLQVVIYELNGSISDTLLFEVQIQQGTTGIGDHAEASAQPFYYHDGRLRFSPSMKGKTIAIYSLVGKEALRTKVGRREVNVADLPRGIYFVVMEGPTHRVVGRFWKP